MFLLIVGLLWTHMHFAQSWQRSGTLLLIVYGMYAIWASLVAAAVLGTSRSTPIAGEGHVPNALSDVLVEVPLLSGSGAALLASAAMLVALYKQKLSDRPAE
jgi:hydroxylaminobenzene mutase